MDQPQEHPLKAVHARIEGDEFVVDSRLGNTQDASLRAVMAAAKIPEYDYPAALHVRNELLKLGVLTREQIEIGGDNPLGIERVRYTVRPWRDPVDDGKTWVQRENERIAKIARQQDAMVQAEYQARLDAQNTLDAPFRAAERVKVENALIEGGWVERIERIEATLARIESALGVEH